MRNSGYDQLIGVVVEHKWQVEPLSYKLPLEKATPMDQRQIGTFTESVSDRCMTGILGTDHNKQPCTVSPFCWNMMYHHIERAVGYALTHSSLFFFLGKHQGCEKVFTEKLMRDMQAGTGSSASAGEVLARACASIYVEMSDTFAHQPVAGGEDRDVFLEQGFLCAIYGFPQVLRQQWVDLGLSWMSPEEGCIGPLMHGRRLARQTSDEDKLFDLSQPTR